MKYSWYREYFQRTLKNIARIAEPYVWPIDKGWLEWFEAEHPEVYKKFVALEQKLIELWDESGERGMEQFKQLCRQYEDTHRWAIGEYMKEKN